MNNQRKRSHVDLSAQKLEAHQVGCPAIHSKDTVPSQTTTQSTHLPVHRSVLIFPKVLPAPRRTRTIAPPTLLSATIASAPRACDNNSILRPLQRARRSLLPPHHCHSSHRAPWSHSPRRYHHLLSLYLLLCACPSCYLAVYAQLGSTLLRLQCHPSQPLCYLLPHVESSRWSRRSSRATLP